jgi:hypothetical protein
MSVQLEKCSNLLCRRLYVLEHFSCCFARHVMSAGVITCPHCGATVSADPALVYSARPLPNALEHWPEEDFPSRPEYHAGPVISTI